jgi:drug/metabolite transporter (DMT)-like permease
MARFTGRAFGYVNAPLAMLFASCVFITLWFVLSGARPVWTLSSLLLLILAGMCLLVGTLLLYASLIQGPVTIAAPITGTYPALVVVIAVILGSRPSLLQWLGTAVTFIGVIVVARGEAPPPDSANQVSERAGRQPTRLQTGATPTRIVRPHRAAAPFSGPAAPPLRSPS